MLSYSTETVVSRPVRKEKHNQVKKKITPLNKTVMSMGGRGDDNLRECSHASPVEGLRNPLHIVSCTEIYEPEFGQILHAS